MSDPFTFSPAPSAQAIEWPGTPIGLSNITTATKSRTPINDKAIDRREGRRDELVEAAVTHIARSADRSPVFMHDVVIHGVRVRAVTNSPHLHDFWVDNWYGVEEWRRITGLEPPAEPQVTVYALGEVTDQQQAAYYSRQTSTIVFFNTAYYGQLKSWVLGAVGRVLAEEHGIHSIHGACVEKDGAGILYIAPTGTGKSTSSYGLIESPRTRFHSDDWVYVRYTFETKDGRRVAPQAVKLAGGREIRGYRLFGWIGEHGAGHPDVVASGLDLANAAVSLPLRDLDLSRPIEAYAYTSEKVFYLRTNLVENFPPSAYQMLRSNMENVPNVTTAFLQTNGALLDDLVNVVRRAGGDVAAHFAGMADGEVRELLARLIAFDNARAMLDIARVLPADRVYSNPMEPARLGTVILLKRNFDDPVVLETLTPERFMGRLLLGETPEKKREIAYNAYRAVDDEVELGFVRALDQQARAERGGAFRIEHLYQLYAARPDVPETLEEEFALFHVMTQACRCYDLNTILTRDPLVADKKDAVALTMELIAYAVSAQHEVLLTLETYRQAIGR